PTDKRKAYAADITYGTNNEFGFDYLRDNMAMHVDERFQRGLHYAIVDEVDSILIDEARTPLIISGQAEERTEIYYRMNDVAPLLSRTALRGAGRRSDHRRRVHRPADAGKALVGRPAPGGGGEGERGDPEREPDACLDHLPELFPHVPQARRHDRHRGHRSLRVPADLRPRDGGDPDAHGHDPRGSARPGVPHGQGE